MQIYVYCNWTLYGYSFLTKLANTSCSLPSHPNVITSLIQKQTATKITSETKKWHLGDCANLFYTVYGES